MSEHSLSTSKRPVLITGGAGFIGANVAHRILRGGEPVILFDNLARPSVASNVEWLRQIHGEAVELRVADVRDAAAVAHAVEECSHVFHLAAQVAVTTSLVDPIGDFEVNARGTLNVLEAVRAQREPPSLIFTSTSKVYGALADVPLRRTESRYEPEDDTIREHGISEARPLDFHSPHGCSKGAADQYVLDYARTFGLPATVFRTSCVYGPRQFGSEDQGFIAHFASQALRGEAITLHGDGLQVRDVLFIDDLVDAFMLARASIAHLSGTAFNIGGGPLNSTSLIELVDQISQLAGQPAEVRFEGWRTGDQRYYVSDTGRFTSLTGWVPRIPLRVGLQELSAWLRGIAVDGATAEAA